MRRSLLAAFVALAFLYLIPIWSVDHLPTSDGPSHLYNSWILRELIAGDSGAISRTYAIDWRPHPNWIGHALLALLMSVASPVIAEKFLFSGIVLLFLCSIWMYCGGRPYAFIAFPFAYHQFLQLGFYNFSISVALFFLILAIWWRRRDRPDAKTIAIVALLLLLCYFSHPMSTVLAIGSIGLLWLLTSVHVRHLLALVPVMPLLIWFALQRGTSSQPNPTPLIERLVSLARIDALFTFDVWQHRLGLAIFTILVALAVVTVIRERLKGDENAFLILTLAFIAIYFIAPDFIAGGLGVTQRVAFFIYLLPLPWLTPKLPRATFVAFFSILALANLGYLIDRYRSVDRMLTEFLHSLGPIPRETTLLPLLFQRQPPNMFVPAFSHLIEYAAIEKRLIDLGNHELATDYFPIRFRPEVSASNLYPIEATPGDIDVAAFAARAQTIFTWHMALYSPLEKRIEEHYRLVSDIHGGRVYRSSILQPPAIADLPKTLLPVAGTVGETAVWRVDQTVRNGGRSTVHLVVSTCATRCEFDLAPGQQAALASPDAQMPFILIYAPRGSEKDLIFSTIVYRGDSPLVEVPAVHESAFRRRKIRIPNVPFGGARLNVRAWFFGKGPDLFFYRILSRDGPLLGEKVGAVGPTAFFNRDDLSKAFPQIAPTEFVDVEVDTGSDDMRVWAFITATDFDGGRVKLHLPL